MSKTGPISDSDAGGTLLTCFLNPNWCRRPHKFGDSLEEKRVMVAIREIAVIFSCWGHARCSIPICDEGLQLEVFLSFTRPSVSDCGDMSWL